MAETDPQYGVNMTVDGINYRRGENKPELPELDFKIETIKAASEVTIL